MPVGKCGCCILGCATQCCIIVANYVYLFHYSFIEPVMSIVSTNVQKVHETSMLVGNCGCCTQECATQYYSIERSAIYL